MSSLFDIAAGLSQFNDDGDLWTTPSKDSGNSFTTLKQDTVWGKSSDTSVTLPARRRQSALCILDETLQTIYNTRGRASTSAPLVMTASRSSEQLENRLQQLKATTTSTPSLTGSELRNVFTHSIAYQQQLETRAEPMSSMAPSNSRKAQVNQNGDSDMLAKTVLREVSDEVEQLGTETQHDRRRTPEQRDVIVRFLTEKYLDARLNKLPGTPFVQLARRRALQKIQQLQQQSTHTEAAHSQRSTESAGAPTAAHIQPNQQQQRQHQLEDASELLEKLSALPPQQREMLHKLALVPDTQLPSLPPAQRELVQFAKRLKRARHVVTRAQPPGAISPAAHSEIADLTNKHVFML